MECPMQDVSARILPTPGKTSTPAVLTLPQETVKTVSIKIMKISFLFTINNFYIKRSSLYFGSGHISSSTIISR